MTGTDALRLDTFVRPYNGLLVLSFYNSSPTHKGSINQEPSSVRGSFGALPLRPTATMRRTSCEVLLCASVYYAAGITAFDGWICRVDVIRVGADLSVRPQNRLRSGEDRRTHRSAPRAYSAPTRTGGHIGPPLRWDPPLRRAVHPKRSRPSLRNEKNFAFYLHTNLESGLLVSL